jgi:hypothetical protein
MGLVETVHGREHSHDDRSAITSAITSAFADCRGEQIKRVCSEGVSQAEYWNKFFNYLLFSFSFHNTIYYTDKGILLATKTLVESIRHYIRHPSGVFSVVTLASSISTNSRLFYCCCFQNGRQVQGLWSWAKTTFITFACFYCKCLLQK